MADEQGRVGGSRVRGETGYERAWAVSYAPELFYIARSEPLAVEVAGARVWPVIGTADSSARPMSDLTGRWGGLWWFRAGPNREPGRGGA